MSAASFEEKRRARLVGVDLRAAAAAETPLSDERRYADGVQHAICIKFNIFFFKKQKIIISTLDFFVVDLCAIGQ